MNTVDQALLVPAIVGLVNFVRDQFPLLKGWGPVIAVLVAVGMFYASTNLDAQLFDLLLTTGAAMGLWDAVKAKAPKI